MIAGAALAALIHRCAPDVRPSTMAAIVRVESGGNPFAIDDNTVNRRPKVTPIGTRTGCSG